MKWISNGRKGCLTISFDTIYEMNYVNITPKQASGKGCTQSENAISLQINYNRVRYSKLKMNA